MVESVLITHSRQTIIILLGHTSALSYTAKDSVQVKEA